MNERRPSFLIIDDNPDDRFLVSKSLIRRFPAAIVLESDSFEEVCREVDLGEFSLVVAHRSVELSTTSLARELTSHKADVSILMISSLDRSEYARELGAEFVLSDDWATIGQRAAEILSRSREKPSGVG